MEMDWLRASLAAIQPPGGGGAGGGGGEGGSNYSLNPLSFFFVAGLQLGARVPPNWDSTDSTPLSDTTPNQKHPKTGRPLNLGHNSSRSKGRFGVPWPGQP